MNDVNDLFYVCSLIEYIGRKQKLRRAEVVSGIGEKTIRRIYKYADIEKTREFQKNIYLCFIDYAKTLDYVDHNKLWKS